MGWKKRLLTLLCAAVLVLGPGLVSTAKADTVEIYLMAENDQMLTLPLEAMPTWIGGSLYVPYIAFDWTATGVNLGVSYGQIQGDSGNSFMLYSLSGTLTFDLNAGTCVDRSGQQLEMRAVSRNGWIFVPLASVCSYFGLRYSYTPTNYGTLIRITNGQERLGSEFIQYAQDPMRSRYNAYMKQLYPDNNTPQPSVQPTPTPSPTPSPGEEPERAQLTVYFAFQCTGGGGVTQILDQLDGAGVKALFLFRPEELEANEENLRRIVGSGHAVGLSVEGTTLSQVEERLDQGEALLDRLVRLKTHTVYLEEAGRDVSSALSEEGWACWSPQLDQTGDTRSAATRSNALMNSFDSRTGSVRVMLDDRPGTADLLDRLLPRMEREDYRTRLALETWF